MTRALRSARPGLRSGRTPALPSLLQPRPGVSPQASHSGRADGLCGLPLGVRPGPRPSLSLGARHRSGARCSPPAPRRGPAAARRPLGPNPLRARPLPSSTVACSCGRSGFFWRTSAGWPFPGALGLAPCYLCTWCSPDLVRKDRWQPPSPVFLLCQARGGRAEGGTHTYERGGRGPVSSEGAISAPSVLGMGGGGGRTPCALLRPSGLASAS